MNKNENKKSTDQWTHRFFKQSSPSTTARQGKTYFAHRYHSHQATLGAISFGALFSDGGTHHSIQLPDKTGFRQLFERELALSTNSHDIGDTRQNRDVIGLSATEDRHYLTNNKALSTQCTVLNCYDETLDTKTFRLGSLDGRVFDYLPGQYITLSVVIAGQEYKRSYSLASSPCHQGILEMTVKKDPNGGVVSNWLNDNLKVGDTLTIKGPYGKFSCAKDTPPKILFLAAGSGIVPIMSMLRWLADTESTVDVQLILSFRTMYDIIYRDELNLIAARHNNVKLIVTLTKEPLAYSPWLGQTGRVNEPMLAGLVPDLLERTVYVCGPDAFMVECKQSLQKMKLPAAQLFCESFTVNSPVVTIQDETISQTSLEQASTAQPSRSNTGNYQISFAKSGKSVAADGAITLLELAEQSGIFIGHECRAGNCGECMVKCLKGKVEMAEQAEISDFDRRKGWVYACCAYPTSNVELEL
jgi:glycine betaine catabolism B